MMEGKLHAPPWNRNGSSSFPRAAKLLRGALILAVGASSGSRWLQPALGVYVDVELDGPLSASAGGGVVQKAVVSSKLRLVFAVGLEGAGHHYLTGALDSMYRHRKDLQRVEACPMAKPYIVMNSLDTSPENYTTAREQASLDMSALAALELGLSEPALATLQGSFTNDEFNPCYGVAMLSYPSFSGLDKVYQYVDLRHLVENAEKDGVDIRVVYLRRPARDMLISALVHRHFEEPKGLVNRAQFEGSTHGERYALYMRTLFTAAGAMHSMLSEIAPSFVVCHDYAKIGDYEQTSKVADFMAPSSELATVVRQSLMRKGVPSESSTEEFPFEGMDHLAERLQKKLDAFEAQYCGGDA